jgi:hypothetical protein
MPVIAIGSASELLLLTTCGSTILMVFTCPCYPKAPLISVFENGLFFCPENLPEGKWITPSLILSISSDFSIILFEFLTVLFSKETIRDDELCWWLYVILSRFWGKKIS